MKSLRKHKFTALLLILCCFAGCREVTVPKPRGYFRIDLPQKSYVSFNESKSYPDIPLTFEYPVYGKVSAESANVSEQGWFNIVFPAYNASLYLTYKNIRGDLPGLIEQTYTMNVKNHIAKADAIDEQVINNRDNKVYGILYDLKGNTATSVQFYVTDSLKHFLRGSLYFTTEPNPDSLAPVTDFFREDIVHLIETLKWEK
ncbi:MAG: gliding motility lipoprotein GldD [Bacteroidales bacterium]